MKKAFTLIELLTVIAIFSLVSGTIVGIFISAVSAQRKILATQEMLSQISYVLEYMGRAIRMAKKDLDGNCIPQKTNYYQATTSEIKFENSKGKCQRFFLDQNQIKEEKAGTILPLTSGIKINSLKFNITGKDQPPVDDWQPRVTISIEAEGRGKNPPKIQIQTSVSQRDLDVEE